MYLMLYQVRINTRSDFEDPHAAEIERELADLDLAAAGPVSSTRLFLIGGATLDQPGVDRLALELLSDPCVHQCQVSAWNADQDPGKDASSVTVTRRAGVMDPVVQSIVRGARQLGFELDEVRTGHTYTFAGTVTSDELERIAFGCFANPVVDEVLVGLTDIPEPVEPGEVIFERQEVALPDDDDALLQLSHDWGLSLNLVEMQTIRNWFAEAGRNPTDIELETLAQTWSEHCKHKTFGAIVDMDGERIDNLLKSTVFRATKELDRDFCVSVFVDNAGIVDFDDNYKLCFKVETHNHPSAIEPYGGAGTGLGGVIRDVIGTGLGGKPVANTDVFCVGHLDASDLPTGVTPPRRLLRGIVSGVRDYGNRMGIPTVNGGVFFDDRYAGNPLVYCGTVGLIPSNRCEKKTYPGDHIVILGGRTGRDGIHGATFSSRELHEESEQLDGGAVQIGNAITEKKTMDVVLTARDRGLYRNITDCGAGGFSSAVGEMGEETGARVDLTDAPLKYPGLTCAEIWISEAQERMVLGVPPHHLQEVLDLAASENVEACVLGEFTDSGRLEIFYRDTLVCDVDMEFLHDGIPRPELKAHWEKPAKEPEEGSQDLSASEALLAILAAPNVASKEWIIRQYDHEVQSTSCVKPLVGPRSDGPGDAAVIAPVLGQTKGFALGNGMNPCYGDIDPYHMACAAIDEAMRNVVAVGGDPDQTSILDNFSWGNASKPDRLGALVRASQGCYDAAMAFRTPFISGKDSLNNEYATADGAICIPHSLLISALSIVEDVTQSVTMDLKAPGNTLYVVGSTSKELGGSHYLRVQGRLGNHPPVLDLEAAPTTLAAMHHAMRSGLVTSCHDCSEGGIAVAAAEMAFAGGVGASIEVDRILTTESLTSIESLFSESLTRFVVEVEPDSAAAFEAALKDTPLAAIGRTDDIQTFRAIDTQGEAIIDLPLEELSHVHRTSLTTQLEGDHCG